MPKCIRCGVELEEDIGYAEDENTYCVDYSCPGCGLNHWAQYILPPGGLDCDWSPEDEEAE